MKYKTPLCKSFGFQPEGVICVSGTGNIDNGSEGGNYDLNSVDPGMANAFSGNLDNNLLF